MQKYVLILCIIFNLVYAQDEFYELTKIEFQGNKYFSSSTLSSVIISRETPFWFWKVLNKLTGMGKEPVYFDSLDLKEDVKRLEKFYQDNGFFLVKVEYSYSFNPKNKIARLIFTIDEGERFRIRDYVYIGVDSLKIDAWLYNKIIEERKIKSQSFFQKDLIEEDALRIVNELRNFGFMLAERGKVVATIDKVLRYVDVQVEINPNRYFTISEIRINKTGYSPALVENSLIYNLIKIKPGQRYNQLELAESQLRLYRTGLFTSAFVAGVIADTINSTVPVNVNVDVSKMNELGPEIIINNQSSRFNLGLGLNFTRKNFFGRARKFTAEASIVSQDFFSVNYKDVFGKNGLKDTTVFGIASLNLSVEQPYLFFKDIKGKWEIYASAEQQKFYRYYTTGSKVSFLFELPRFVFFNNYGIYFGYESEKIDFKPQLSFDFIKAVLVSSGFPLSPEDTSENILKSESESFLRHSNTIIGLDLFGNHENDMFYPTKGFNIQLSLEFTGLLPYLKNLLSKEIDRNIQYYKTVAGITVYTNPWKPAKGAVAYKLRIGYMQKIFGEKSISQSKLFFAGGSNSIRGWRARSLSPSLTYLDVSGKEITITEIGGRALLEGSIESRNIIIGDLGSAVFFDFGNTWSSLKQFNIKSIAVTFGLGLRYYTSFAPFRLDFGTQFYDPFTQKTIFKRSFFNALQIHLGIGEAF